MAFNPAGKLALLVGGGPAPGGAIITLMGGATITDSTFIGNQAIAGSGPGGIGVARGGGVYNFAATATITNCVFTDNVARGGSNVTGNAAVIGSAFGGVNQSYHFSLSHGAKGCMKGSCFSDAEDECDSQFDVDCNGGTASER